MSENPMRAAMLAMLNRPDADLIREAGGAPRVLGGRTLDPRFQFLEFQSKSAAAGAPPAEPTPEAARAQSDGLPQMFGGDPEPGVVWSDITIPAPGRTIAARAYRPEKQDPKQPLIVFYHFGGGVIGSVETCHCFCSMLAKICSAPVLSIEYRLAPEHKFPAGVDDAIDAYAWAVANADKFGAPKGKGMVGGDSMGGNFSAVVCQEMKRTGGPAPLLQLLIYPALDFASEYPSMTTYAEAFPLSAATMHFFGFHYMKEGDDAQTDAKISPLRAKDVSGLPRALIYTAGFDPLVDEGPAYAERLKQAGVPVTFHCFDSLAHAFTAFTAAIPAADAACRRIAEETNRALIEVRG